MCSLRTFSAALLLGVLALGVFASAGCQTQVVAKYHCEACVDEGVAQPETWYVVEGRSVLGHESYTRKSVTQQQWEATPVTKR